MEEILTEGQEILATYLSEIGMPFYAVTYLVMLVWEEEATMEMLEFLLETRTTDYNLLYETALKISSKHPLREVVD